MFSYKTKHAKVSFQKVIKYSYRQKPSSNARRMTMKNMKILVYKKQQISTDTQKDDFKEALVNLQYHVENQEIEF
jgi:hypothetical protein